MPDDYMSCLLDHRKLDSTRPGTAKGSLGVYSATVMTKGSTDEKLMKKPIRP
jgi:hypothetical protein